MTLPRSISTHNPWIYEGKVVTADTLDGYFGYVYQITDRETGKKYIGRKYIWSYRKEKGASRRKKKESDWQDYYSSNDELKKIGIVMKKAQYFITCHELPMKTVNEMTPQAVRSLLITKPNKKKVDERQLLLDFHD